MFRVGPVDALWSVIGRPGRRWFCAASALQAVERVALALAALWVVRAGTASAIIPIVGLGAIFVVRAGVSARLRVVARARVIEALTAALFADGPGLTQAAHRDTELALVDGVYAAEDIVGQRLPALAGDAPACIVLAVIIASLEPWPVVLEGGVAVALGACAALLARRATAATAQQLWTTFVPVLEDLSTAIQARLEIAANGSRDAFLAELAVKLSVWERRSTRAATSSFLAGRAPTLVAASGLAVTLAWRGDSLLEQLGALALLAAFMPAFAGLARGLLDLRRDVTRALPVMRSLSEAYGAAASGVVVPSLPGVVEWRGLSFTYPGDGAAALHDVGFRWSYGELVGLAGRNGSGKSTFLRLLLGMAAPTAGALFVAGASIVDVDRIRYRRSIGYLAQRPFLSDRMSVVQAIRVIAPGARTDAIERTLQQLGLWPVLVSRDADAPLDVKLGTLSAGEKQRVAIGRVFLRDAALIILDEPDANLDADGVTRLRSLLRDESRKRMVVFAAHDPGLLAGADRVLSFEGGRISEDLPQRSSIRGHGPSVPVA